MLSTNPSLTAGRHLLAPEMHEDPYTTYREWQTSSPVFWDDSLRAWVVTRYADVELVLGDPRFSSNRIAAANPLFRTERYAPLLEVMSHKMSEMDEPHHTRLRSLVNKAFVHVVVEAWEPRVRNRVDTLLDNIQKSGECEFVRDFAAPLPLLTIMELVGVPAEDMVRVRGWCDDFALVALNFYTQMSEAQLDKALASIAEFREHLETRIAKLRTSPEDNLLSAMVAIEQSGERLTTDELLANVFLLLAAGNETTTCLLTGGLVTLLEHPEQMQRLRDDPSLIPSAIEEFLRYDSPLQYLGRLATDDIEIGGQQVKRGDLVLAVLAAANRDPEKFASPDTFDITRPNNHHLAFGHGRHFCVGLQFARLEARLAFTALLERTTKIELALKPGEKLVHQANFNIRRVERLPVKLEFV
jgi:cytochrome P450